MKLKTFLENLKKAKSEDISYIEPLINLTSFFALTQKFDFAKCTPIKSKFSNLQVFFWSGLVLTAAGFSFVFRIISKSSKADTTVLSVDIAKQISLAIINSLSFFRIALLKKETFFRILKCFVNIDKSLNKWAKETKKNYFYVEIFSACSFIAFICFLDAYFWLEIAKSKAYIYFVFENFQYFLMFLIVLLMYNFTLSVWYRFERLNEILIGIFKQVNFLPTKNNIATRNLYGCIQKVKLIRKTFLLICDSINLFNDTFGWILLFLFVTILTSLLSTFTLIIYFGGEYSMFLNIQAIWSFCYFVS